MQETDGMYAPGGRGDKEARGDRGRTGPHDIA